MEEKLCELLSSFKVLSHKVHVMHVGMIGDQFISYHPFLGEIYDYLEDQIDWIMERMDQLDMEIPTTLLAMVKESVITEIDLTEVAPKKQLEITYNDLLTLIDQLQDCIVESGDIKDFVTQNKLIDFQEAIGTFEWKIRRTLGVRKSSNAGVTVFEDGIDGDDD